MQSITRARNGLPARSASPGASPAHTLALVGSLRSLLLPAEAAAFRTLGTISRATGRGGGTTLPGKLLWRVDRGAIAAIARRFTNGVALVSATNGKTTTAAMATDILEQLGPVLANPGGANLTSGVSSSLLAPSRATRAVLEVDEAALPPIADAVVPRVICLGNLFRDQLDRYGELEHVANRWKRVVEASTATLVVNADDPRLAALARGRERAVLFGVDDPRHALPGLQHAVDSVYCTSCGTPYAYTAIYSGHLGDYACPNCGEARPPLDIAACEIELRGLEGSSFTIRTHADDVRVELAVPGLYNVYNAVAAAALAIASGATLANVAAGLSRFTAAWGRFERIPIGDRQALILLIKNPAGANEAVRTLVSGGAPRTAVIALNDEIADGRDVSWIWDVDFEPLAEHLDHLVATGTRAEELALRFAHGGLDRARITVEHDLELAFDRGLAETASGGELVVMPTYTAMLELRGLAAKRGGLPAYWEATT